MSPNFAQAVDPIFLHVLGLLERIELGEAPAPHEARLRLRGLLDQAEAKLGQTPDWQAAKFALVAWIDEVLIEAVWPGRDWWNENALEVEMFNTRLANELFYQKAKEATALTRRDALEVYYVCVVLGFRGLYRDPMVALTLAEPRGLPANLETWAKQTAMMIRLGQGRPMLNQTGQPGSGAPPLAGQTLFVWSLLATAVLVALGLMSVMIVLIG